MKQRQVYISVICLLLVITVGCYSEKHIEAVSIFEESESYYASVGQQIVRKGQAKEFQEKFAKMSREEIESITLEELQQLGVLDYNECFESIVEPLHLPEGVSEWDIYAGTLTHAYTTGIYKELYDVVLVRQVYSIDKKTLEVKCEEERRGYMKYDYHPSPEPYVVNW